MRKELIFIGSVNKAFKAKEILKKYGITSQIERGTNPSSNGCGYSVLIVNDDKNHAKEILIENGLI